MTDAKRPKDIIQEKGKKDKESILNFHIGIRSDEKNFCFRDVPLYDNFATVDSVQLLTAKFKQKLLLLTELLTRKFKYM